MFEVQLGASMLLQFHQDGRTVRVLADAGTSHGKYPPGHVLHKLKKLLAIEGGGGLHGIDLLICTHYDGDHLNCLVPIIETFVIGEAWLPPVAADDRCPWAEQTEPAGEDFLGNAFANLDRGTERLHGYLDDKAKAVDAVAQIRTAVRAQGRTEERKNVTQRIRADESKRSLRDFEEYFRQASEQAGAIMQCGATHACGEVYPPIAASEILKDLDDAARSYDRYRWPHWILDDALRANSAGTYLDGNSADPKVKSLASIEKSLADQAITAIHLKRVVDALHSRRVPMKFKSISDGKPDHYSWCKTEGRFRYGKASSEGPGLVLLGPSKSLIEKHWRRLPVSQYVQFALLQMIPVKSSTPSNALSYSMIFSHAGQRILVSGDTGFVDFVEPASTRANLKFYPDLIAELKVWLPVVQVAHHGGTNKYFYHALIEAGYSWNDGESYLLLSHEVASEHRPSPTFGEFIAKLKPTSVKLLFTSRPRRDATKDYVDLYAPPVGSAQHQQKGDIQLIYDAGTWEVKEHAIMRHI